jgi:hypothetical protein
MLKAAAARRQRHAGTVDGFGRCLETIEGSACNAALVHRPVAQHFESIVRSQAISDVSFGGKATERSAALF